MVVQMPGWKGLANARVTIFGDVYPVEPEHQVSPAPLRAKSPLAPTHGVSKRRQNAKVQPTQEASFGRSFQRENSDWPDADSLRRRQELAREIFRSTHSGGAGSSHQWGNFTFFRMENISDIYFVGGFGTVQWVDVDEYVRASPDAIVSRSAAVPVAQLLSVRPLHPRNTPHRTVSL